MAGANLWSVGGQSVTTAPQWKPFCCLDSSRKKPINYNFSFVYSLGWNSVLRHSRFKPGIRKKFVDFTSYRCGGDGINSENTSAADGCSSSNSSLEWDWNRWSRHFTEIEQAESYASVLKFQLDEAIEKEEFQEASKLKKAIAEATSMDIIAEIMFELKNAIDEERYHDASRLCKQTKSGLVGWWVGYSTDSRVTSGRLVHVTPGMGRFIAKTYTPRQLVKASSGTPSFEIFVVKDAHEGYMMQVVALQAKTSSATSTTSPLKSVEPQASELETPRRDDEQNELKRETIDDKGIKIEGATEEGIKSVINFLKDKIPGLKVKVMKLDITGDMSEETDSLEQLIQDDGEKTVSSEDSEDESEKIEEIPADAVILEGSSSGESSEDMKDLDMKLLIGGVVHNTEDTPSKGDFSRIPAEIKDEEKDSFVLHIPGRHVDNKNAKSKASRAKVEALAAKGLYELMASNISKEFLGAGKVSKKGHKKNMSEIIKFAASQAQKKRRLSEYTNFSRITTTNNNLDPFDGLYVGAFGFCGTEVVQLRRKYGQWNSGEDSSDVEFFEYVEAVKLTGDLNVPAGQVVFRAKIASRSGNSNRGKYPKELGVVASYKAQGRIADFGFKDPKWVEGELLQLNGKGIGPYLVGADLGFLYIVPEKSFMVLLNRLRLPE